MEILIGAIVVAVGLAVGLVAAAGLLARRAPGFAGSAPARVRLSGSPSRLKLLDRAENCCFAGVSMGRRPGLSLAGS